jgi:hypothetical protein
MKDEQSVALAQVAAPAPPVSLELGRARDLASRAARLLAVEWTAVVVLAALAATLFFHRLLPDRHAYASNDLTTIVWPFRVFISQALAAHQLPLWVPGVWAGAPFLADNDVGLFYPFQLPYLLMRPDIATGWVLWLHAVLSVVTMYAFCRLALRVHPAAAFGAGLVFAFNGYALAHTGLPWSSYEAPWPPLMFLALHRTIEGRWAWAWLGPAAAAMALLGGQAQNLVWTGPWLAAYAVVLTLSGGPTRRRALAAAVGLGSLAAGGALLAAIQVIPEAELLANGARLGQGLSFGDATFGPLVFVPPWQLLLPDYARVYVGEGAAWIGFVATAVAAFGLLAAFRHRRGRALAAFFALMAATCYVLALGAQTPLYRIAFDVVPGMHQLRLPVRWLYPLTIALSALVGLGLDELRRSLRNVEQRRLATATAVLIVAGTVAALLVSPGGHVMLTAWTAGHWLRLASVLGAGIALVAVADNLVGRLTASGAVLCAVLAIGVELFSVSQFMEFNGTTPLDLVTPRPIPAYVARHGQGRLLDLSVQAWSDDPRAGAANTVLLAAGGQSLTGYSSSWPTLRGDRLDRELVRPLRAEPARALDHLPALRGLGVRYLVVAGADQGRRFGASPDLALRLRDGPYSLFELREPGARAWASCGAAFVASADEARTAVLSPSYTPGTLLVEGAGTGPTRRQPAACGQAAIASETLNSVTVRTELPAAGWLVLADSWYPGWQATVDGRPADIRHANFLFRAVAVPAGAHEVTLEYRPMSFALGAVATGAGAVVWLVSLVWILRRRSRRAPTG